MTQGEALAREVLLLSRNTLLVNLRFLDAALSQFVLTPAQLPFATDGQRLFYDPRHVLLRYKEEKERAVRDYLHLVMHCVFRHMYVHTLVDRPLWDLACDIGTAVAGGIGMIHEISSVVAFGSIVAITGVTQGRLWYVVDMLIGAAIIVAILFFAKPKLDPSELK